MWIPPFFTCGECGGEVGLWPMTNLLRQKILDWRHRTVPDGIAPHRAVLGTPAHRPRVNVPDQKPAARREEVPPPEVPARPAMRDELPASALRLDQKADAAGWTVEAWYMRGTRMDAHWRNGRVVSSVVLRLARGRHRLIASWTTGTDGTWEFEFAYSITHEIRAVGSPELNQIIKESAILSCDDCGETPALHVSTDEGLVCFNEYRAHQARLTEEVPE